MQNSSTWNKTEFELHAERLNELRWARTLILFCEEAGSIPPRRRRQYLMGLPRLTRGRRMFHVEQYRCKDISLVRPHRSVAQSG